MPTFRLAPFAAAVALAFATSAFAASAPASGLDRAGMDPATRAQDDLFVAMNGRWLQATEIPGDRGSWGTGAIVNDRTQAHLHAIVDELLAHAPDDADGRRLADQYRAFVDTAAIDQAGLAPIQPQLREIDAVQDKAALVALMGRWSGVVASPVVFEFTADPKNPSRYVADVEQGGLGLPDRDYLLKDDERYLKARKAYVDYMTALLSHAGDAHAAQHAQDVLALETKMAQAQWSRVEMRDPVKMYNPMTPATLAALAPGMDWAGFLRGARLRPEAPLVVQQPSYMKALAQLVASEPLQTWQAYVRVRRLDAAAAVLPAAFRDARFAFRGTALSGTTQDQPRWRQGLNELDALQGEALGRRYVAHDFPPEAKARMQALVGNLMKVYATSIDGLTWMGPATKAAAREKLGKYTLKIGYPDAWRDYSALVIKPGDALGNRDRAATFEYDRQVARVGGPVDRREWGMTPQTVDAYYEPTLNEIVFPAAILQPPFFDMAADDAVNYGAIGAVIGHEISHGFDDEGSQYDGDGRLRDWWTADDRQAFTAITEKLAAQYDAYEPVAGKHVNGYLTLGENIADMSGLQIAYKAYELSLNGRKSPVIDGLTGEQRFFLGYAQAWRNKQREATVLRQITSDPHSPPRFRADGAAINNDGFHEAFGTKPGDGMYKAPADRIRLW